MLETTGCKGARSRSKPRSAPRHAAIAAVVAAVCSSYAAADSEWQQRVSQLKAPAADEIVFTSVGDVGLNKPISNSTDPSLLSLFDVLRASDVSFMNTEQVLTDRGFPDRKAVSKAPTAIIEEYKWAGTDLVSLGNNHQMDYFLPGLQSTIATFDAAGIVHAGSGNNIAEAFQHATLEKKGIKIGLVAALVSPNLTLTTPATNASPGAAQIRGMKVRRADGKSIVAPNDDDLLLLEASIKEAKKTASLVIVSLHFHWAGDQEQVEADGKQLVARAAIEAGADIVLGHGTHVLNGIELYKNKLIAYSLGNFVFQIDPAHYEFYPDVSGMLKKYMADPRKYETVALRLTTSTAGQLRRVELLPVEISKEGHPHLIANERANQVLDRISALSKPLGTRVSRQNWYSVVELPRSK